MNLVLGESTGSACFHFGPVAGVWSKNRLLVLLASLSFVCFILAVFFVGFRKEGL